MPKIDTSKKGEVMKHTIEIDDWTWGWFDENRNPQGFTNLGRIIRAFISEKIAEECASQEEYEESVQEIEDQTIEEPSESHASSLSGDARNIVAALEWAGLTLLEAPRRGPIKSQRHGACTITEALYSMQGKYNAPDLHGKQVLFAKFSRGDEVLNLKVLPVYGALLAEIERYQQEG